CGAESDVGVEAARPVAVPQRKQLDRGAEQAELVLRRLPGDAGAAGGAGLPERFGESCGWREREPGADPGEPRLRAVCESNGAVAGDDKISAYKYDADRYGADR